MFSIADSGANISVTNPSIAQHFELTPQLWVKPFDIRFGNNSVFKCTHYVDFGAVLGKVAIVDDAPDTLISIASLAERGIETRFNRDLDVGLFLNDQLLYRGRQNPRTRLYEINLSALASLSLQSSSMEVNSVKRDQIDGSLIREVPGCTNAGTSITGNHGHRSSAHDMDRSQL
jgi:hypothetical protein